MFADKKSHSPEIAPSGVKQDMLVAFMTCLRYSLGSLQHKKIELQIKLERKPTYDIFVVTLTRFSHSNSVHMLRNCGKGYSGTPE